MSNIAVIIYTIFYCIFCWCCLTSSLFYYLHQFYQLKRNSFINKRHYRIVIALNIFISLYIIFMQPFKVMAVIEGSDLPSCYSFEYINQQQQQKHDCSVFLMLSHIFDSICSHGWAPLLVARAWLIYFDTTYSQKSSQGKWMQFINPQSIKISINSWIIRYRSTLGSERWVLTRIYIPYYIVALLSSTLSSMLIDSTLQFDLIFYIPLVILFVILWFKSPKNYDLLKVRHEMVLILRCVAVDVALLIILVTLESIFPQFRVVIILISSFTFVMTHWFYAVCTTKWVISYSGLNVSGNNNSQIQNLVLFMHSNSTSNISSNDKSKNDIDVTNNDNHVNTPKERTKTKTLMEVLSESDSLSMFMDHLCNEWAIESLLFIIECYQLKQFINETNNDKTFVHKSEALNVILPMESLPKSSIVYDDNSNIKDKMKILVNKYIRNKSEFQVNISYYARDAIIEICDDEEKFKNISDKECYQYFDDVLAELFDLMQDSYFRFLYHYK